MQIHDQGQIFPDGKDNHTDYEEHCNKYLSDTKFKEQKKKLINYVINNSIRHEKYYWNRYSVYYKAFYCEEVHCKHTKNVCKWRMTHTVLDHIQNENIYCYDGHINNTEIQI